MVASLRSQNEVSLVNPTDCFDLRENIVIARQFERSENNEAIYLGDL
ncbi:hypothetical protein ACWIUD_02295 [Helicobacter sp. 23-1044]